MAKWLDKLKNYFADNPIVNWFKKFTGSGLTTTETQQNLFNSNEAALQRDWSSQEAERARDWNEQMYEKYNSLSGKIAQAEQAGVNPLFAVTGNSVTPMSTASSAPSGASASSGGFAPEAFTNLIGQILGIAKVKSEVANIEADTDFKRASAKREEAVAEKTGIEASWVDSLSQAQLDHLVASKDELETRLGVNSATANKLEAEFSKLIQETARIAQITDAEVRKTKAEATLAQWQSDNKELLVGLDVGADVLSAVVDIATTYMSNKTKLTLGGK